MARVCVFDVNETLLDLGALDPHFERVFGDAGVRRAWFLQLLQSALVATVTGGYSDFGQVGAAALWRWSRSARVWMSPTKTYRRSWAAAGAATPPGGG
jgi:hypothetical protein